VDEIGTMGLIAYLDSTVARDPAPRSRGAVLLGPSIWKVGYRRVAHALSGALRKEYGVDQAPAERRRG
jgi:hypothetical protein